MRMLHFIQYSNWKTEGNMSRGICSISLLIIINKIYEVLPAHFIHVINFVIHLIHMLLKIYACRVNNT